MELIQELWLLVLAEVRYEFAQVFLETHNYVPSKPVAQHSNKDGRTRQFTSPYWEWWNPAVRVGSRPPRRCLSIILPETRAASAA